MWTPTHGGHLFWDVACWPTTSSPGRYLPRHFSATLQHRFTSRYSLPLCLTDSHMWTHTHKHTRSHTIPQTIAQPPSRLSRIWPLVKGCLWAIVCSADDHCHRLIPLPIAVWWMGPTLTSTDMGVLDHWGRRNERRGQWGGELDLLGFFLFSRNNVSYCSNYFKVIDLQVWWGRTAVSKIVPENFYNMGKIKCESLYFSNNYLTGLHIWLIDWLIVKPYYTKGKLVLHLGRSSKLNDKTHPL